MVERATLGEAASLLSERIRQEGGQLQKEFELGAEVEASASDEASETGVADEQHPEPEVEAEAEAPEGEGEEDARFELPQGVNELAEMLGLDAGDMYGLTVNVDLGSESRQMTLEELKAAAAKPARDEVEIRRWEDAKRAEQQEIAAQREALETKRRDADHLATIVFSGLNNQEQQVQSAYDALLRNVEYQSRDPQGYQVELMRHNANLEQIRNQKQGLMAQMDQMRQQMDADAKAQLDEAAKTGRQRLREMLPEWSTDEGYEAGASDLRQYVMQDRFGVTPQEIDNMLDPRIVYWAEMARRYEALQTQAKQPPKPTAKPKLVPGAQQVRLPRGRRAELEAMDRLKKSGSIDDAREALTRKLQQMRG